MPKKSPILLITAILGLLAIGGVAFLSLAPKGPPPADPNAAPAPTPTPTPAVVFVANRDIPVRTKILPTDLRRSAISGAIPADAIQSVDQVKGQLTKFPIPRGEAVTLASFAPSIRRAQPANIEIPPGFRAFTIYTDMDSTIAGLIDVGDRVDVVASHRLSFEKGPNQYVVGANQFTSARLIGTNLLVLAVDASIRTLPPTPTPVPGAATDLAAGGAAAPPPPPPPPPATTPQSSKTRVVLAAPPLLATQIIAAADQGQISLLLRNPNDSDAALTPETRQYPSRLATRPNTAGPAQRAPQVIREERDFPRPSIDPPTPRLSTPIISTPPIDPGGLKTSPAPPMFMPQSPSEITVIRGTEKTRVLVPQR